MTKDQAIASVQAGAQRLMLAHRSDRKVKPDHEAYRPVTLTEARLWASLTWPNDREIPELFWIGNDGRAANVRRNGKIQTWKRDESRISIPLKYGMYDAFRADEHDLSRGRLIVRVLE